MTKFIDDEEYPDPHPEEKMWEAVKHLAPEGKEDEYRALHKENYHLNCPECSNIKMHNKMVTLKRSLKNIKEGLRDIESAKMSGICRNCSTLRDVDGRCGCNG